MSPDGASFHGGLHTLYDLATLNVIGQQSTANAPFAMSGTFSTTFNVGGSVFSPDGTTLYSAFNTAALTTPPPPPQATDLLIRKPTQPAYSPGHQSAGKRSVQDGNYLRRQRRVGALLVGRRPTCRSRRFTATRS